MAVKAPLNGNCADTVELPGKRADGSLGKLRFTCDASPGQPHKDHHHKGIIGDQQKPGGSHIRYTIIWTAVPNRPPISASAEKN